MVEAQPHLRVFGFPVFFRPSFLVLALLAILWLRELGLVAVAVLGASILVHELGHSIAFRQFGTESHIVIHLFGGYSSPDQPHKLTNREWVSATAAGPGAALLLLGIPAMGLRFFLSPGPLLGIVLDVLVWFNVYWSFVNLLPIWPLDGGRIVHHWLADRIEGNSWPITQRVTLIVSAIAMIAAYSYGYTFGAIFLGFNAYRVFTSRGPDGGQNLGGDRIAAATKDAKSYERAPVKTSGADGQLALDDVYNAIANRRDDRAEEALLALEQSEHRLAAQAARVWQHLLADRVDAAQSTMHTMSNVPALLVAVNSVHADTSAPLEPTIAALRTAAPSMMLGAPIVLLHRLGRLSEVAERLTDDQETLGMLERVTLKLGLVPEQIAITAAMVD